MVAHGHKLAAPVTAGDPGHVVGAPGGVGNVLVGDPAAAARATDISTGMRWRRSWGWGRRPGVVDIEPAEGVADIAGAVGCGAGAGPPGTTIQWAEPKTMAIGDTG